jgi:protein-S-isoprenylcysteine O-methyltransferase Ste14
MDAKDVQADVMATRTSFHQLGHGPIRIINHFSYFNVLLIFLSWVTLEIKKGDLDNLGMVL